jgi:hypothetical protein
LTFGKDMKKRKWRIITGLGLIALLMVFGLATYKKSTQIDLGTGLIRYEQKALWITFYRSSPERTEISQALGGSSQTGKWLTIAAESFSFPRARIYFCYPGMLFQVGAVDRAFNNHKVTALTAKLALDELAKTEDTCRLKRHLQRFWNALSDDFDGSWNDSRIDTEIKINRIWQNTTEDATSNGDKPSN